MIESNRREALSRKAKTLANRRQCHKQAYQWVSPPSNRSRPKPPKPPSKPLEFRAMKDDDDDSVYDEDVPPGYVPPGYGQSKKRAAVEEGAPLGYVQPKKQAAVKTSLHCEHERDEVVDLCKVVSHEDADVKTFPSLNLQPEDAKDQCIDLCKQVSSEDAQQVHVDPSGGDVHDAPSGGDEEAIDDDLDEMPKVLIYKNFQFTLAQKNKKTLMYRCLCYRLKGASYCPARCSVDRDTGDVTENGGEHLEQCFLRNDLTYDRGSLPKRPADCRIEMTTYVDAMAVASEKTAASTIATDCINHFRNLYPQGFYGQKVKQIESRVYATRKANTGGDVFAKVMKEYMPDEPVGRQVLRGVSNFVEPNRKSVKGGKKQTLLAFSNHVLLQLLKAKMVSTTQHDYYLRYIFIILCTN